MKTAWRVFLIVLFVHLAMALGFCAWLYASGRVDHARLAKVVDTFKQSIDDEQATLEAAQKEAEDEQARQQQALRLEAAKDGPMTLGDRLTALRRTDERAQLRIDRLERARADIQSQIELAQSQLAEEHKRLEAARAAFEKFVDQRTEQIRDEDFQQAVTLLEAQKPKQAKAMIQTLLAAEGEGLAVDYLAAMQTRTAAKVLAEFKTPEEVVTATGLIEALRQRGVFTVNGPGGGNDA